MYILVHLGLIYKITSIIFKKQTIIYAIKSILLRTSDLVFIVHNFYENTSVYYGRTFFVQISGQFFENIHELFVMTS